MVQVRILEMPTALVFQPQIVTSSAHESAKGVVPVATSGYDGWKKVNGSARLISP